MGAEASEVPPHDTGPCRGFSGAASSPPFRPCPGFSRKSGKPVGGLLHPQATPGKEVQVPSALVSPKYTCNCLMPPSGSAPHREGQGLLWQLASMAGTLLCLFSPTCPTSLYPLLGGTVASVMTHASPLQGLRHQLPALQVQSHAFGPTQKISPSKLSSCKAIVSALAFKASCNSKPMICLFVPSFPGRTGI